MCWSGEASAVLATAGLCMTAYLYKSGESKELWLTLFYFTLMEVLQAFTYIYINQCSMSMNKALTFLGYVHIAFQPFFINMAAMYFIPQEIKMKISKYVYTACGIGAGLFMFKVYPFADSGLCVLGQETFCGPFACSLKGNWHIAWQLPLNDLGSVPWFELPNKGYIRGLHSKVYLLVGFIMPFMYGSWRLVLLTYLLGPFIAHFSTNNLNEFAAVWCLYSIGLCCTMIKSPIRKYLHVKNWFWYRWVFVQDSEINTVQNVPVSIVVAESEKKNMDETKA